MMKVSFLVVALALGFGIAAAHADETTPAQVATQPSTSAVTTEQQAFSAYKANVNPTLAVPTTGAYDQEDQFVGRHGFPLEGYREIANPPA